MRTVALACLAILGTLCSPLFGGASSHDGLVVAKVALDTLRTGAEILDLVPAMDSGSLEHLRSKVTVMKSAIGERMGYGGELK